MNQSPWTPEHGAVVTANDAATTDPNGGTTAERLTGTESQSDVYQIVSSETVASGKTYTFSVYLKAPSSTSAKIVVDRLGGDYQSTTVTVGTTWQRFTFTHDGTWTASQPVIAGVTVVGIGKYVWMWGAQLEVGSSVGEYVATTTTPAGINYTYDYDRYGNRWHQNVNNTPSPGYSFNASNQIDGFDYDAAGNITSDGVGGHRCSTRILV